MSETKPRHYAGTRRRAWRRSTVLIVLAIVIPQAILAVVLAASVGIWPGKNRSSLANAGAPADGQVLTVGQCVRDTASRSDDRYVAVGCSDHRAYGSVIEVVDGGADATEACREDTDFFATQLRAHATPAPSSTAPGEQSAPAAAGETAEQVVCLRRLGDTHPGASGTGGGVYRSGDCVTPVTGAGMGVREVACSDPAVYEVITERAKTVAECTLPAHRFATLQHGTNRVLCLADGAGLAGPGECMGDPGQIPITFAAEPCDSPQAKAEILDRAASAADCRLLPGQTHYLEDPNGLPRSRIVCLKVR